MQPYQQLRLEENLLRTGYVKQNCTQVFGFHLNPDCATLKQYLWKVGMRQHGDQRFWKVSVPS